jgi:transcriptional regulator with XRE-family HTH domain
MFKISAGDGFGMLRAICTTWRPHGPEQDSEMTMKNDFVFNPAEIRRSLGMKQEDFWRRIGVTQSGGSRYEAGRRMPNPVRELLRLVYIERIDLSRVNREDFDLLQYLKGQQPAVYEDLRRQLLAATLKAGDHESPSGERASKESGLFDEESDPPQRSARFEIHD